MLSMFRSVFWPLAINREHEGARIWHKFKCGAVMCVTAATDRDMNGYSACSKEPLAFEGRGEPDDRPRPHKPVASNWTKRCFQHDTTSPD
jgi:hypothetical protein